MIYSIIVFLCSFAGIQENTADPVKWSFNSEKMEDNQYKLVFTADIAEDWVIYAIDTPDGGPIATAFYFDESADLELVGSISVESEVIEKEDDLFEILVRKHTEKAIFSQIVKVAEGKETSLSGELEFMTCDGARCLPPKAVPFNFDLK